MRKRIKGTIKNILRISGVEVRRVSGMKNSQRKNIIDSVIRHPDLVESSATVQFSELQGKISIGPQCIINKVLMNGNITVGRNTTINGPGTEFYCIEHPIVIGNFCSIARGTAIQEHNHNLKSITTYFIRHRVFKEPYGIDVVSKGPVTIGNDVWIATQCVILSGVTIGNGAVIAANSVVSSDVPPYAIVGGTPAKIIGYRFSEEVIERLQQLRWWEWPEEKILANHDLFQNDLTLESFNNIK